MPLMSVTPEVSQLEMSVLKFVNPRKSWLMSVMDETSQSAMRPYVAVAAVGFASNAPTAVLRKALVVKVPGGEDGGGGGDSGGDGGDGGDDGDVGGDCGDGGWSSTTKDSVPCSGPLAKEKVCPKPGADHSAPFQPSPYESVMSRVHVAPSTTANGELEVYGAPPLSVVPSEQLRLHPTSLPHEPPEEVIAEEMTEGVEGGCGGGGEDGGAIGGGGDGGGDGGGADGESGGESGFGCGEGEGGGGCGGGLGEGGGGEGDGGGGEGDTHPLHWRMSWSC